MRQFVVSVLLALSAVYSLLVTSTGRAADPKDVATFKQAGDFIMRTDGKALTLVGGPQRGSSASLVDPATGKVGKPFAVLPPDKVKTGFNFMAADPTGRFVVRSSSAGADKPATVATFDATTGKEVGSFTTEKGFQIYPQSTTVTPDGKTIVHCASDEIRLLDPATGKARETIKLPKGGGGFNPAVSHDGKWLVVEGNVDDGAGFVYDLATRELKHTLGVKGRVFQSPTFSTDGKYLITRSEPGRFVPKAVAAIWKLETGAEVRSFEVGKEKGRRFGAMAFGKDSAVVAIDENDGVLLFDVASGRKLGLVKLPLVEDPTVKKLMRPSRLAFSPGGALLAVVYDKAQLAKVYDVSELLGK